MEGRYGRQKEQNRRLPRRNTYKTLSCWKECLEINPTLEVRHLGS
uniref:Uncharacterized protein n=1 Tax=Vitis vinifera TaxID=29760 RepID=F6I256_VITVI